MIYLNPKHVKEYYDNGGNEQIYNHPLTKDSVVLDIGAYQLEYALELNNRYQPTIHAYEPQKQFLEPIHTPPNIFKNYVGVSTYTGTAQISDDDNASSLYSMGTRNVTVLDIREIFRELDFKGIDLIKLNIEGEEYNIINTLNQTDLSRTKRWLIQFHENIVDNKDMFHLDYIKAQEKLSQSYNLVFGCHKIWQIWERK